MFDRIRVGVNGYGVIGKRVADAVALQDDMELIGISDIVSDYRTRVAAVKGYNIYASMPEKVDEMRNAGLEVVGTLDDLLDKVDIVVDCTPKKVGTKNKPMYETAGVKAVFQGGEEHGLAGVSFVAQVNYREAIGRQFVRVVSCNTTGLCRIVGALHQRRLVKKARATLFRRGTDPWESHVNGLINTAIPEGNVPSHQGPDAQTVMHDLDIVTMAASGPFNLSHLHSTMIETTQPLSKSDILDIYLETPRVALVSAKDGLEALNSLIELMRDLGRPRNDMWEVGLWQDIITTADNEVYMSYQVHNESIAIPENIDCIRAMTELDTDPMASIDKTDRSLGIKKDFFPQMKVFVTAQAEPREDARYGTKTD